MPVVMVKVNGARWSQLPSTYTTYCRLDMRLEVVEHGVDGCLRGAVDRMWSDDDCEALGA